MFAACNDADTAPLTCSTGQQAIMGGNDHVCLCTGTSKCVYGDSTHCTAECR